MSPANIARPFYYLLDGWYKGGAPNFYDPDDYPGTKILKDNYAIIKEEIEAYYRDHRAEFKINFTPYSYEQSGWKTINLYSYFLKYPKNCRRFPKTDAIVNKIPGMCLAQVAVLEPGTKITPHFGDTNAIVRSHLGITIPGDLPELGLRIRAEERCWKEGEALSFCIVNRHCAWNLTDQHRIILMVDAFLPAYFERRYEIAGNTLAAMAMKLLATKMTVLKHVPRSFVRVLHPMIGWVFRTYLFFQRVVRL